MPNGQSQTAVTAWPSTADLSIPTWLIQTGRLVTGALCALFLALVFKLAVKLESPLWAAALACGTAAVLSSLAALVLPAPSMRTRLRGLFSALIRQPSSVFMLTPGLWLTAVVAATVFASAEIGVGLLFVLLTTGYLLGSMVVDRTGLGWNYPRSLSVLLIPGFMFICAGFLAFNIEQILSMEECITTPVRAVIFSFVAFGGGISLSFQNAALSELAHFLGRQARASAFCLWTAAGAIAGIAYVFDAEKTPDDLPEAETIYLLLAIGLVATPLYSLTTHLAPHGATVLSASSELTFVLACVPLIIFEQTSLPNRPVGFTELLGVALIFLGFLLIAWGAHRKERPKACVVGTGDMLDACQVCARNDQELFIGPDDFQTYGPDDDVCLSKTLDDTVVVPPHLELICSAPKPLKSEDVVRMSPSSGRSNNHVHDVV